MTEYVATRAERAPGRAMRSFVIGLPAAAVAVAWWDPARHGGPAVCPWRALTGVACPGCGLTRATGALLHGRFGDAFDLHPFALVVVIEAALLWAVSLLALRRGGRRVRPGGGTVPALSGSSPRWVIPAVVAANVALLLGVWVARAATGTLPPP
jgi:hypothetical protein